MPEQIGLEGIGETRAARPVGKRCRKCGSSERGPSRARNVRSGRCLACARKYQRDWASTTSGKAKHGRWARSGSAVASKGLRAKQYTYGTSEADLRAMWEAQHGSCASCGTKLVWGRSSTHVDHDHTTKKVRGFLCLHCNVAAGMCGDSSERADSVAAYLRKHGR